MFLEVAYGIGIIGVLWFAADSSRIPSIVWFWSGYSRAGWWTAMIACFVALGIPALIAALVWRFGAARKGLRHEVDELRGSGRAMREERLRRSTGSIA
jgi:hypothetical protein